MEYIENIERMNGMGADQNMMMTDGAGNAQVGF